MIPAGLSQAEAFMLCAAMSTLRPAAAMVAAPLFSNLAIPLSVRLVLAFVVGISVVGGGGTVADLPSLDVVALICAKETAVGLLIGFALGLAFSISMIAGELISQSMGFSFAATFDPVNNMSTDSLGKFISVTSSLLFFATDSHLIFISTIHSSYTIVPLSDISINLNYDRVVPMAGMIFSLSAMASMAIIATITLSQFMVAMMSKSSPQINMFSIGFSVFALIGLSALYLSLPEMIRAISDHQLTLFVSMVESMFGV